jgi:hypothetical protein
MPSFWELYRCIKMFECKTWKICEQLILEREREREKRKKGEREKEKKRGRGR